MNNKLHVLLAEPVAENATQLNDVLRQSGLNAYSLTHLCKLDNVMMALKDCRFDICFIDHRIGSSPHSNDDPMGFEVLRKIRKLHPAASVILWNRAGDQDLEVDAIRKGLADFAIRGEMDISVVERNLSYAIERCRVISTLRRTQSAHKQLIENAVIGIFQTSPEGQYITLNPALAKIYGYESPDILKRELINIADQLYVNPGRRQRFAELLKHNGIVENFESEVYRRDGRIIWISENARRVLNENNELVYYEGFVEDVTNRKEAEARLLHEATHDHLTGLPNRLLLRDRLEQTFHRFKRHANDSFAVLFIDLNRFKIVNDSLGHDAGDALIRGVADRLRKVMRSVDTVARLGGDEFAILLDEISSIDEAIMTATRVHEQLQAAFIIKDREVFVGGAIGIVQMHQRYENMEDLLRDADTAMYLAKSEGVPYRTFDPGMHLGAVKRLDMETRLRNAVQECIFDIDYQPIIDMHSQRIFGVEAFVRWNDEKLGNIPPKEFINIAEDTGLIHEIDIFVLNKAIQQVATWNKQKLYESPLHVNCNITVRDLVQIDFVKSLQTILEKHELHPSLLCLDLVEGATIGLTDQLFPCFNALHRMGVKIMVDDFGTGYSSMTRLHELPFHALKVDQRFFSSIGSDDLKSQQILNTILLLSQAIKIDAVAEGVETTQQVQWAFEHGCRLAQGNHFYPPAPASTIQALLADDTGVIDLAMAE